MVGFYTKHSECNILGGAIFFKQQSFLKTQPSDLNLTRHNHYEVCIENTYGSIVPTLVMLPHQTDLQKI